MGILSDSFRFLGMLPDYKDALEDRDSRGMLELDDISSVIKTSHSKDARDARHARDARDAWANCQL